MEPPRIQQLERTQPELWRLCCPRVYAGAGQWHSARVPAATAAFAIQRAVRNGQAALPFGEQMHYIAACLLSGHDSPTYHISRSLLDAVARTNPPESAAWRDIAMPHPAFTVMLPNGSVEHPRDGAVAALTIARFEAGTVARHPFPGTPMVNIGSTGLMIIGSAADLTVYVMNEGSGPGSGVVTGDLAVTVSESGDTRQREVLARDAPVPLPEDEVEWHEALMRLALGIVLVMNIRPDLMEGGSRIRAVKPGDVRPELWSPTVLGRNYRVAVTRADGESSGSHAAPRLHWRRGHYAAQAHGSGRALRRIIWREPVLVGG